ncbi:hypothetical protein IWW54_005076, partial [Coemansia sp. RSA 2705]
MANALLRLKFGLIAVACMATVYLLCISPRAAGTKPLEQAEPGIYSDALNRTLGFQHVYVISSDGDPADQSDFQAIAALLDIDVEYVRQTSVRHGAVLQQQDQYLASAAKVAELDTHARIYADMVTKQYQSALIVRSTVDVELDLKQRLARALGGLGAPCDLLFVGRSHSEPTEPRAREFVELMQQTRASGDLSARMQRVWAGREFLGRAPAVYRASHPRGVSAYAVGARMARRLHRRLRRRMRGDEHDLDYILADVAMFGLSVAYSVAPPPVVFARGRGSGQYLARSALHAMSMREDDPAMLPPYEDWLGMWQESPIQANSNKYYRATNTTLGFQKIFVLNMPQRRDRRQNMSALARFHTLHLTYAQTVDRHEADALAAANSYLINGTHLACYLSHLRVYQRMVRDHIETALILEDDVDVELDLKPRHAAVMREVGRRYGRDWDMLYLGHCTRDSQEPASSAYVSLYEAGHPMCLHA